MNKKIYYLIYSPSFGDTLAATPTLRYLSQSHESKINVVTYNTHIFKHNPYVNECMSFSDFESVNKENIIKYESFTHAGRRDGNGIEKKFSHIDLRQIHAFDLGFQLMPHQMEYDFYPDPVDLPYEFAETYVVCHITQNWPNRTWATESWQKLVDLLTENKIFTVLVGKDHSEKVHNSISVEPIQKKCPKLNNLYGLDLSNKLDLDGMYHVINNAKILITMCSGAMNIGGCTDTHILQVGSAQNPLLRIPYRNNTQNYKYDFVGGSCSIFCNMDLKYNVKEWGDINSVAPLTECSEKKPTFECHPQPVKVFEKVKEILNLEPNNKCENYLEILPFNETENRINFNFKKTLNKKIKMEAVDALTGLKRNKWEGDCVRLEQGNYWWTPNIGKLNDLGSIYVKLFVDGEYIDKILVAIPGGKKFIINNEEYYFDNLDDYNYTTFWEIFIHNEYQFEGKNVVDKNDIVLDIGANFGFFALHAIESGAKTVYCVEPFPTAYENIKNISKKLPIVPINKAVSSKIDNVTMSLNTEGSASNCLSEYNTIFNNNGDHIVVEPIHINNLIESIGSNIDLIKIDCEGSELDLFETISSENLNKINKMVIETHSDYINNFIKEKLLNNNFEVKSKKGMFGDGSENILFVKKIIK